MGERGGARGGCGGSGRLHRRRTLHASLRFDEVNRISGWREVAGTDRPEPEKSKLRTVHPERAGARAHKQNARTVAGTQPHGIGSTYAKDIHERARTP